MVYRVIWSTETSEALDNIINYLQENWYESDIIHFLDKVNETLKLIQGNPYLFRHSFKQQIHEVLITKHNLLIYEVDDRKKVINLLTIIDSRSNPKRKSKTIRKRKPKL